MTDTYTMKSVFSCSDFLSDIWPGGADAAETLDPLASCPSEDGSTHLGRRNSADLLNLLIPTEETDSHSRIMQSLAASSSNKESPGEPVESNLLNNSVSEHLTMSPEPFLPKQASTSFPQYNQHLTQLQPISSTSSENGVFHIDPITQAKAICNRGMNATVLQQQLAEMKSRAAGVESFINHGMQAGASTSFLETGPAQHHTATSKGTPESLAPPQPPPGPTPTTASVPQVQLSLQESQLRQLASMLGSANMAALQSMTMPAAAPSMPGTTGRGLTEQPSGSTKSHEHSSGDDDTGTIPELHKLTSAGDSLVDEEEHERAWEAKLDKNLPPPEMKRMRRMLSNRESARRSRRRKQAHMQDLEVQNIELEEANQKLQKELSVLRTLAKEAIMEKKKSQTALETLKHQVVHLLGQHDMVTQQELAKQREGERQEAPTPASTGTDSDASGSGRLEVKVPVSAAGSPQGCLSGPVPQGKLDNRKHAPAQKPVVPGKAAVSPKSGTKRKELNVSSESGIKRSCVDQRCALLQQTDIPGSK